MRGTPPDHATLDALKAHARTLRPETPIVVNARDYPEGLPAGVVYCGRGGWAGRHRLPRSRWANPYAVGRDGTREEVIAKFRAYALDRLRRDPDWLLPLRGATLMCHCKRSGEDVPCHADVLVELIARGNA